MRQVISDCLTSLSSPDLIYTAGFQLLKRIVSELSLELEELGPSKRIGPQQDEETVESWADRNGLTYGNAWAWALKGVLRTVKPDKRHMLSSALLRTCLLEMSTYRLEMRSGSSA